MCSLHYVVSSNSPQILITIIRVGKTGTDCTVTTTESQGEGRRRLQEMRKCQSCEIQVRLQDQLVHHDLMTGDTFLSSSELMVLSVSAVLTAMNKLLLEVSKPSVSNSTHTHFCFRLLFCLYTS